MFKTLLNLFRKMARTTANLNVKGVVTYRLFGPDGKLKDIRQVENLITLSGFDFIAAAVGTDGSQPAPMKYIAIGTGTTAASTAQTLLVTEVARQLATYAHTNGTQTWTEVTTFAAGVGTGAITESGMFNVATANTPTMLNRQVFAVINKGALDSLQVTWTVTLT